MAGERLAACAVESLGIPGDRGWALRDETRREITNGKHLPLLLQCAAVYRNEPANGTIPQVDITLPDGGLISSDDAAINARLSEALGRSLTLWPRLPASNKAHYRRANLSARIFGRLCRLDAFRAMLPVLTRYGTINSQLRQGFSREAGEPIPDISVLPASILEFTSPPGTYFDAFPVHILTSASLETLRRFNPTAAWDVRRFRPNFLIKSAEGIEGLTEPEWAGRTLRIGAVELKCEIPTMRCGMTMQAQAGLPKDSSVLRTIVRDANQNLGVYANVVRGGMVSEGDEVELM